uniref:SAC3/GANP/THP3 conserved domain-containing protein n=1 Tax=Glossina brevipalpis TaxID=37001 RepID=A0A1A9WRA9_9MUSC
MSVQGVCEDFCPQSEAKLRIREKLLHFYEYKNGQKNVPGILVKSFARSAAGLKVPKGKDLRTIKCLHKTTEYLLNEVILDKRKPFCYIYDFIFDRLRAIRQEVVIQNLEDKQIIKLLEPMIMFLAFSRYKLCEETIGNFDEKICELHLQECLKRVLVSYDNIACNEMIDDEIKNRAFVEALYQIFNLGSIEALNRCVLAPQEIKSNAVFALSFKICLSYFQGNLYRVLMGLQNLPHILCAIGSLKMQMLRKKLLEMFSYAYHSKFSVPANFVLNLTAHANKEELFKDCEYFKVNIATDNKNLYFQKGYFRHELPALKCKHEQFVDIKLEKIYLPEILLLKKL